MSRRLNLRIIGSEKHQFFQHCTVFITQRGIMVMPDLICNKSLLQYAWDEETFFEGVWITMHEAFRQRRLAVIDGPPPYFEDIGLLYILPINFF